MGMSLPFGSPAQLRTGGGDLQGTPSNTTPAERRHLFSPGVLSALQLQTTPGRREELRTIGESLSNYLAGFATFMDISYQIDICQAAVHLKGQDDNTIPSPSEIERMANQYVDSISGRFVISDGDTKEQGVNEELKSLTVVKYRADLTRKCSEKIHEITYQLEELLRHQESLTKTVIQLTEAIGDPARANELVRPVMQELPLTPDAQLTQELALATAQVSSLTQRLGRYETDAALAQRQPQPQPSWFDQHPVVKKILIGVAVVAAATLLALAALGIGALSHGAALPVVLPPLKTAGLALGVFYAKHTAIAVTATAVPVAAMAVGAVVHRCRKKQSPNPSMNAQ